MRDICSRIRRTSVPAGRLSVCHARRDTPSTIPSVLRRARLILVTASKYVSVRTAASTGSPIARSRRYTALSQSGWFAGMRRR